MLRPRRACLRFADVHYCIRVFGDVKPRLLSFSGLLNLSVMLLLDSDVPSLQAGTGRHVADCAVKPPRAFLAGLHFHGEEFHDVTSFAGAFGDRSYVQYGQVRKTYQGWRNILCWFL
jgi:hypothetical protein